MLSIRPFANLKNCQRVPTGWITSTYMLAAFFTGVLITITRVIELLSAQKELAHYGIWATAHDGAAPTRRGK
jgi:hypothetical protein